MLLLCVTSHPYKGGDDAYSNPRHCGMVGPQFIDRYSDKSHYITVVCLPRGEVGLQGV